MTIPIVITLVFLIVKSEWCIYTLYNVSQVYNAMLLSVPTVRLSGLFVWLVA